MVSTGNGGAPSKPAPGNDTARNLRRVDRAPHGAGRRHAQADRLLRALRRLDSTQGRRLRLRRRHRPAGEYFGTASLPHLAVAVGKEGYVYLLEPRQPRRLPAGQRRRRQGRPAHRPATAACGRAPACGRATAADVYIPTASAGNSAGGSSGFLRVYKYGVNGEGKPTLSLQATSSDSWGFGTGAPIITSEGTTVGLGARLVGVDAERHGRRRAAARVRPGARQRQAGAALERGDRHRLEVRHAGRRRGTNSSSATAKAR